jgi:hypothetical protein
MTTAKSELPMALQSLDVIDDLTENGIREFCERLRFVREIGERTEAFFRNCDHDLKEIAVFFDSIELDMYSAVSIGGHREISPWRIHSSWTFETRQDQLVDELVSDVRLAINHRYPGIGFNANDATIYLNDTARALVIAVDIIFSEKSFQKAIANLIAVDQLLLNMLGFVVSCRFSQSILLRSA